MRTRETDPDGGPGPRAAAATLALLAIAVPLFFLGLGHGALSEPDEPYYAVPAREMLRTGDFTVTTLGGEPWFDKPILFYWVVAASFRAFGVSEGSARAGSAPERPRHRVQQRGLAVAVVARETRKVDAGEIEGLLLTITHEVAEA